MSEFNPFGAAEEAPAYVAEESEESTGSRRNVVLLGALAAVVLGAGAFLFLGGGGDDELEEFSPVTRAPRAAAAAPSVPPAVKLPAESKVSLGRNPFRALYIQPAAAPAEPAAGAPAPAGTLPLGSVGGPATSGGTTTGTTSGTGTGSTSGSTSGSTGGTAPAPQAPTAKEYKLVLTRVFGTGKDQSAAFTIDGKQQTAKIGSTFGPHAEILLLSLQEGPKNGQWTAVLQVGDGDPFDVVTGVPAYVR